MDKWEGTGQYHPDIAWKKIQQADSVRELESKFPTKWWHDFVFSAGALLLAGLFLVSLLALAIGIFGR